MTWIMIKVSTFSPGTIDLNACSCQAFTNVVTRLTKELFIMRSQTIEQLEVLVPTRDQLHDLLNNAESALRQVAMVQRSAGILVTRHHPGRYTLSLNDTVPFGETWEQSLS